MKTEGFFLHKKGDAANAFVLKSFELAEPTGIEVMVEVEAFGLNYADVMARRGLYREAPPMPCIIGYEVVGKIVQVGPNVRNELLGKRVIAFCRFGGYAKHIVTNDMAVVEVGNEPAEQLLALCTQAVTAYYMSEYLTPVHASDIVLIHAAAGGVGTILVQLAKQKAATVIAKVSSEGKSNLVKSLGADYVVNYKESDYESQIKSILNGKRIDISFNAVAGSTYKTDMRLLGSGGRMVLFGGAELGRAKWGIFSTLNFVRRMGLILPIGLMMRSKNVLGVNMLKIADNKPEIMEFCLKAVLELYKDKKLVPQIGGKYKAAQLADAHQALESGTTTGKLSVFW